MHEFLIVFENGDTYVLKGCTLESALSWVGILTSHASSEVVGAFRLNEVKEE